MEMTTDMENMEASCPFTHLLDLDAYELLSLDDSLAFRRDFPDSVLTSRFVDRWKPTDDGGVKAKSRIVIHGFKDPHVLQLERSAPTPTNEAFTTVMQTMASNKWEGWSITTFKSNNITIFFRSVI